MGNIYEKCVNFVDMYGKVFLGIYYYCLLCANML